MCSFVDKVVSMPGVHRGEGERIRCFPETVFVYSTALHRFWEAWLSE